MRRCRALHLSHQNHRLIPTLPTIVPAANINPSSSPNLKGAADDIVPLFEMLGEFPRLDSRFHVSWWMQAILLFVLMKSWR